VAAAEQYILSRSQLGSQHEHNDSENQPRNDFQCMPHNENDSTTQPTSINDMIWTKMDNEATHSLLSLRDKGRCKHKVTPLNLEDSMDIDETTSGSVQNEIEERQPDDTDSEETQLGPSTSTPVSRFKKKLQRFSENVEAAFGTRTRLRSDTNDSDTE
ncbi:unnamed protein product, partial [Acanthoscelides obtectus]